MDGLKERLLIQRYSGKNRHRERTQDLVSKDIERANRNKKLSPGEELTKT